MGDSSNHTEETHETFGFGFHDSSFSNRVLQIEIIPESVDYKCNRKRGRVVLRDENGDETECCPVEVKTLHINSLILAAKSSFFYKLFKNGMKESEQRHVTLKINASEEASLMEVLRFMYSNTLSAVTASKLVDVLITADKFEVPSCVSYCSKTMQELPMSLESALLYLSLPSSLLGREAVNQLIHATKQYLVDCYGDMTKSHEAAMPLPLSVIEVVLSSDNLKVRSEDDVLDFILKLARARYPNLEERREVLISHLLRLLISDALFHKADQEALPAGSSGFVGPRSYQEILPVKIVRFASMDRPHCLVYLEIKKQDLVEMLEKGSNELVFETFSLGPRRFSLRLLACKFQDSSPQRYLDVLVYVDSTCSLECKISAMLKSSKEYKCTVNVKKVTVQGGITNSMCLSQSVYNRRGFSLNMTDNSEYFNNGVLYLRVDLTLINQQ